MLSWFRNRGQVDENQPASGTPDTPNVNHSLNDPSKVKEHILRELDILAVKVRASGRDLPPVAFSKIRSIDDKLRSLMDYVELHNSSPEQEYMLTHMVKSYIPDSINTFLSIHPEDRGEGTVPFQNAIQQFDLLDRKVEELDQMVRSGAVNAQRTQGFFLEMKFDSDPADN